MLKKIWVILLLTIIIGVVNVSVGRAQNSGDSFLTTSYAVVNVHDGPGIGYTIVGYITQGQVYSIIRESYGWWFINLGTNGTAQTGWVNANFVTVLANGVPVASTTGNCTYPNHIAPTCPTSQAVGQLSYQPFQHGFMLWHPTTREIDVLFLSSCSGGKGYAAAIFQDTWTGQTLPQQTPPPGLQQPQMGFGTVWLNNNLAASLGWATTWETPYTAIIETTDSAYGVRYIRLPEGEVIALGSDNGGSWWNYVGHAACSY
jgi:hypothetical protein